MPGTDPEQPCAVLRQDIQQVKWSDCKFFKQNKLWQGKRFYKCVRVCWDVVLSSDPCVADFEQRFDGDKVCHGYPGKSIAKAVVTAGRNPSVGERTFHFQE